MKIKVHRKTKGHIWFCTVTGQWVSLCMSQFHLYIQLKSYHACFFMISCNNGEFSLLHSLCFWWIFKPPDVAAVLCFCNFTPNQQGLIFAPLSSPLLYKKHRKNRVWKAKHRIMPPLPPGKELARDEPCYIFSERLNPSEQFLSWAPPGSPPTYSLLLWATRRACGQIGFSCWPLVFD